MRIDWGCSGFSARSLVCRRLLLGIALATVYLHAAHGSPDGMAKTHRRASAATVSPHRPKRTHRKMTGRAATDRTAMAARGRSLRRAGVRRTGAVRRNAALTQWRGGMPRPLRGSLESLERQNARNEDEGLERIEDDRDLRSRIANGFLVPLPESRMLAVNPNLPVDRRYCRPWTAVFLTDLAHAHAEAFHGPLEVSSAVRTVEYQKRLMETNGNAAPAEGDIVSPHVTGATVDVAKRGMSVKELGWMRRRLLELEHAGKIDVEEEFEQACFHITVYKSYAPGEPVRVVAGAGKAAGPV